MLLPLHPFPTFTLLQISRLARSRQVVYMRMSLPPPVSDREMLLHGFGVDALDDDESVLCIGNSIEEVSIRPGLLLYTYHCTLRRISFGELHSPLADAIESVQKYYIWDS